MKSIIERYKEPDYLGENDYFRKTAESFVERVVKDNSWFTMGKRVGDEQVDILKIKNNEGVNFGRLLFNDAYTDECEMNYLTGIYKYFLRNYLCYYEAPTVVRERNLNGWRNTYNKYVVTSNIIVIANWLGITVEEADERYGGKLALDDDLSETIPYYKLYTSKEGIRKISVTKKDLDLSIKGTRITPIFALKVGIDILYEKLLEDTYTIVFQKDSGQIRELNTTFNMDKIRAIYKNQDYIVKATDEWYQGDFDTNPNLERGYLRVFEMGASIYDKPIRSINMARILSFRKEEPDLSYINIDLDSVMNEFQDRIKFNPEIGKNIKEFVEALDVFNVGLERKFANGNITNTFALSGWAESQYTLLSTVFLRELSLFMLGNPQWFEGYTGEPYVSEATGVDSWDDGLDIG